MAPPFEFRLLLSLAACDTSDDVKLGLLQVILSTRIDLNMKFFKAVDEFGFFVESDKSKSVHLVNPKIWYCSCYYFHEQVLMRGKDFTCKHLTGCLFLKGRRIIKEGLERKFSIAETYEKV
jgi:hypothetical protein